MNELEALERAFKAGADAVRAGGWRADLAPNAIARAAIKAALPHLQELFENPATVSVVRHRILPSFSDSPALHAEDPERLGVALCGCRVNTGAPNFVGERPDCKTCRRRIEMVPCPRCGEKPRERRRRAS